MDDYNDIQKIADSMSENVSLDSVMPSHRPRPRPYSNTDPADLAEPYGVPIPSIIIEDSATVRHRTRAFAARLRDGKPRRPAKKTAKPSPAPRPTPESISGIGKRHLEL